MPGAGCGCMYLSGGGGGGGDGWVAGQLYSGEYSKVNCVPRYFVTSFYIDPSLMKNP